MYFTMRKCYLGMILLQLAAVAILVFSVENEGSLSIRQTWLYYKDSSPLKHEAERFQPLVVGFEDKLQELIDPQVLDHPSTSRRLLSQQGRRLGGRGGGGRGPDRGGGGSGRGQGGGEFGRGRGWRGRDRRGGRGRWEGGGGDEGDTGGGGGGDGICIGYCPGGGNGGGGGGGGGGSTPPATTQSTTTPTLTPSTSTSNSAATKP